jgi:hypothetical protein|tara:strand:- start:1362 stop:1736 length:375 start_codon:yes stop_codon:yes gene_type:complete
VCSGGVWVHIFDVDYVAAVVDEGNTQRNESIFHPEAQARFFLVDEQHAGVLAKIAAVHQASDAVRGFSRYLGVDLVSIYKYWYYHTTPLYTRPAAGQQAQAVVGNAFIVHLPACPVTLYTFGDD